MNKYRTITIYVIAAIIAVIVIWDIAVIQMGGVEASISQVMRDWSKDYPVFTFAIAFSMGHLFWGMSNYDKKKKYEEIIEKKDKRIAELERQITQRG